MLELAVDLISDALKDTLYLVPFLLVTYLLLEALEHKAGNRTEQLVQKAGHFGPAVAAILGAVPQCGFSAAGAALFSSRAITLGTLFAVFLSTSDEMLPLFIAEQVDAAVMLQIIGEGSYRHGDGLRHRRRIALASAFRSTKRQPPTRT